MPASVTTPSRSDGTASAFASMPVTPANHFALHVHAAVHAVLATVRALREAAGDDPDAVFDDAPFLHPYLAEHLRFLPDGLTWAAGSAWWWSEIDRWAAEDTRHLPLRALTDEYSLSVTQRLALALIGLLEEDSRFGTLFADLQAPVTSRRPTVELLGRLLRSVDNAADGWRVCRPLVEIGLVEVVDRGRPRAEWSLRIPHLLWDAARGEVPTTLPSENGTATVHPADGAPEVDDLFVPAATRDRLRQVPRMLDAPTPEGIQVVVVRGTRGSDRLAALSAIAQSLGRGTVWVLGDRPSSSARRSSWGMPEGLGPFCVLTRTMPIVRGDLAPGESEEVPSIPGYEGPLGVALSRTGGLTGERLDGAVTLTVEMLSAEERRRYWQAAFGSFDVEDLEAIVDGFQLPGRWLRRTAQTAVRQARLDRRHTVTTADVRRATRSLGRQLLDTLAERLPAEGTWAHLVVDASAQQKLQALQLRCRHRERLLDHLGPAFGGSTTKGVRALFSGPSGTGKTLAARILAAELEMDLYRVDLAAVINKYVGETEKNLHAVLSTAEELDVILLLDEGDALLGRRTEVVSANDRYANVETNYLLQRLEHYAGIVLVTTNLGANIDPAFQRRMDVVVDFAPPSADARLAIWSLHLPAHHAVPEAVLRQVATQCSLHGGQIRNAALQATLLAVDEGPGDAVGAGGWGGDGRPRQTVVVRPRHLLEAVRSEYRKAGALCPLAMDAEPEGPTSSPSGAQRFMQGFAS